MAQSGGHGASSEGSISTRWAPSRVVRLPQNVPMAKRPSSVSPTTGEGWKLTHLQERRDPHRRGAVLDCVLHLLEGAHLDLAHALARDADFLGQLHERDLLLANPPPLDHPPPALAHCA